MQRPRPRAGITFGRGHLVYSAKDARSPPVVISALLGNQLVCVGHANPDLAIIQTQARLLAVAGIAQGGSLSPWQPL
jgi:hypothetical protein